MHDFLAALVPICSNFTCFDLDFIMIPITLYALLIFTSYFLFHDSSFSSNATNLYNSDVIIYKIKKWREQFYLWTSLPNFPITTSTKFLSSFIKKNAKTSTCYQWSLTAVCKDIRGRIYNCIPGGINVQLALR
jgi:hypothetical protein